MAYRPALTGQIPQVPPGLIEAWAARRHSVTPRAAFRTKLREVAEAIASAATGKPMPELVQEHLAIAVRSWQALGHERGPSG